MKKHLTIKCNYPLMAGALILAGLGSLLFAANVENPPHHAPARHAQTSHVALRGAASTTPTGHSGGATGRSSDAEQKSASRREFAEFYQHQAAARQSRLAQLALAEPAQPPLKSTEDQAPPPSTQAAAIDGDTDGVKYQPLAALPAAPGGG